MQIHWELIIFDINYWKLDPEKHHNNLSSVRIDIVIDPKLGDIPVIVKRDTSEVFSSNFNPFSKFLKLIVWKRIFQFKLLQDEIHHSWSDWFHSEGSFSRIIWTYQNCWHPNFVKLLSFVIKEEVFTSYSIVLILNVFNWFTMV